MRTTVRITVQSEDHAKAKELVTEDAKRVLGDLPFEIQSMTGESYQGVMTWEAVVVTTDPAEMARRSQLPHGIPQHLLTSGVFTPPAIPVDDTPFGRLKDQFDKGTGVFEGKPE